MVTIAYHTAGQDEALRQALERNGQRLTEQRAEVYRFLRGTREHPTADEVFTSVRARLPDISLATVYKALETLVSCRLALKLSFGDGSGRYDARTDDHCHSRCLACGSVRDVPGPDLCGLLGGLDDPDGFRVEGVSMEVIGYCPECRP
ncbi:MAG: Fur family transcriptional regulator [Longimicrobiaceae bacterium]